MGNVSKIRYSYRYVTFFPYLLLLFMSENVLQLGTTLCAKLVEMCKQNRCQYLNPQDLRVHSGICLYEWWKGILSFLPLSIWKISYFPFFSKVSKISYRYLKLVYLWVSPILYLRYSPTLGKKKIGTCSFGEIARYLSGRLDEISCDIIGYWG